MSNRSNGPKYLDRTIDAIVELKKKGGYADVSVKNIRRVREVNGSNRSAVAFYTKALIFLEREGALEIINHNSPKKYKLIDELKLKSFVAG